MAPDGDYMPMGSPLPPDGESPVLYKARLSSFVGMSIGAEHYYLSLTKPGTKIRVEQILSAEAAASYSAKDRGYTWREGSCSHRWDSRSDAIAALSAVIPTLGDNVVVLLTAASASEEWTDVLGTGDVVAQGHAIFDGLDHTSTDDEWERANEAWRAIEPAHNDRWVPFDQTEEVAVTVGKVGGVWTVIPDYEESWDDEVTTLVTPGRAPESASDVRP